MRVKNFRSGAAFREAWRWRVLGFDLCGCGSFGLEIDGAVGGDHLGDGVFEGLDAFSGDGGDRVEGELAALREGGELL